MFEKADFMVAGFAKSGSSSLYNMLKAEQGISMSSPKEPNFFNEKVIGDTAISAKDLAEYHSLWEDTGEAGTLYGEASVLYGQRHSYPHAVENLHRYNKNLKMIFVARDPISQVRSHIQEQMKWTPKKMISEQVVRIDPLYLFSAMYNWQITPFVSRFGRANVHALTFESLMDNPQAEILKIRKFLDLPVEDNEVTSRELIWSNRTSEALRPSMLGSLMESVGVGALGRMMFPHRIRALFYPLSRKPLPRVVLQPDTVNWLKHELRADSEKFLEMFGLDGSSWNVLEDDVHSLAPDPNQNNIEAANLQAIIS